MDDVHGNLDPRAQEFIPYSSSSNYLPLLPPNQFYYPCPPPPPPLPPLLPPPLLSSYGDVVGYPTHTPAYISTNPPIPTPCLPPQSPIPTRTLLLSMVPNDVSESIIRRDLEIFGDVRAVQMEKLREGIVTVHFYDLRHAQRALVEIQEQHMQQQCRLRKHYYDMVQNSIILAAPVPPVATAPGLVAGCAIWAQFTFPTTFGLVDGTNQGTLVVFNLDSDTSTTTLKDVFQAFGHVKELRETPMKRHQKFVEFYDVRDAARALMEMNGKEFNGKNLLIEFSRPGGNSRRYSKFSQYNSSSSKFSPNFNNQHSSRMSSRYNLSPPSPNSHSYNRKPSTPRGYAPQVQSQFPNQKSSYFKGNPSGGNSGSDQSSGCGSIQDSLASLCMSNARPMKKNVAKKCNNVGTSSVTSSSSKQQQIVQVKSGTRPWKGCSSSSKQANDYDPRFLINEDAIMESNCRDSRTTVMIKNIPNKYSQKLLLNMLDNHCIHCNEQIADGDDDQQQPKSSYDFVYLPIDFINKCNVGYGFVNMTSPEATLRLYKAFHHQSWEVFNSRKICQVTYARLQGIEALKEHFKNSKFPCDADEYMPVIFSPPRDGKLLTEPVPIVGRGMNPPSSSLVCSSSLGGDSMEHLVDNDEENGYNNNDDGEEHEETRSNSSS